MLARLTLRGATLILTLILISSTAFAQTFISGSTGADGALDFSGVPSGTTILFDPDTFAPPLDQDGDNVYHFTTITIPAGVTVQLSAEVLGVKPVVWLASGAVQIAGVVDLDGRPGHNRFDTPIPSVAGAGGFRGGVGRRSNLDAQPGDGPGGGHVTTSVGGGAGHAVAGGGGFGGGGAAYGNDFLLPLVGGSGGAGGAFSTSGCGGGAGGGALLIASSVSTTVNGTIRAVGGSSICSTGGFFCSNCGGAGSGGAIRLMAPIISVSGSIFATGSFSAGTPSGSHGRIRLEAFQSNVTGSFITPPPHIVSPGIVFLPDTAPSVRVVRVAGVDVPENSTGSFFMPDVTIDNVAAAIIEIEARNVPLGTVVQLSIFSETGLRQVVESTPFESTEARSNATAVVTLPHGFSRFYVQANWMP